MKALSIIFLSLQWCFLPLALLATDTVPVVSSIREVTVFTNGAQVYRDGRATIPAGQTELVFKGLSAQIKESSIQVKADAALTILSVRFAVNYIAEVPKDDEIKRIEREMDVASMQLSQLGNTLEVLRQDELLVQRNQVQVVGIQNNAAKAGDLKELADYQRLRLTEILTKKLETEQEIKKVKKNLETLQAQKAQLSTRNTAPSAEITVVVNATSAMNSSFLLSYFVESASWVSAYDVRVKDITSPVSLFQRASLYQNSGEDWRGIRLKLSTGNPTENNVRPTLTPWNLRFASPYVRMPIQSSNSRYVILNYSNNGEIRGQVTDEQGEPLIGVTISAVGTAMGVSSDVDGNFVLRMQPNFTQLSITYTGYSGLIVPVTTGGMTVKIILADNGMALSEVVVTGYARTKKRKQEANTDDFEDKEPPVTVVELPTTLLYEIDVPVTVLSNGQSQLVDIKTYDLAASYRYFCTPKLNTGVFLTAEITNWEALGLLSGGANLFFEGTYLGKTYLEFANTNDTLLLSLGRDQNITVTRTKVKEFSQKQFLGNKKEVSRVFEITVKNKKKQAVDLVIEDQVPVSTQKEIEVDIKEAATAQVESETGKLTWAFNLPATQDKKIRFGYSVRYPKSKTLVLE